ncbi:hypothetical protein BJ508DRAFT_349034, partial [Ascobolus immersus RN42]
ALLTFASPSPSCILLRSRTSFNQKLHIKPIFTPNFHQTHNSMKLAATILILPILAMTMPTNPPSPRTFSIQSSNPPTDDLSDKIANVIISLSRQHEQNWDKEAASPFKGIAKFMDGIFTKDKANVDTHNAISNGANDSAMKALQEAGKKLLDIKF